MPLMVIARTAAGRPTLQHVLMGSADITECGLDVSRWSRAYSTKPVSQIICKKCEKKL